MDRNEFILAMSVLLFGAFCLGFMTQWVITRLSRVSRAEISELDKMAEDLHAAEETRDAAMAEKLATEARIRTRQAQTEAELQAAMDGLRDARREAEELRKFISENNMKSDGL